MPRTRPRQIRRQSRQYETVVDHIETNESGKLVGVVTAKTRWTVKNGKAKMEVLEADKTLIPADLLLIASGFSGCEKGAAGRLRPGAAPSGASPPPRTTPRPTPRCSWPAICAGARPWWSGPSPRAAPPPRPWTPTCWAIPTCNLNHVVGAACMAARAACTLAERTRRGGLYIRPSRPAISAAGSVIPAVRQGRIYNAPLRRWKPSIPGGNRNPVRAAIKAAPTREPKAGL